MKLTGKCKEAFEKWADVPFYGKFYEISNYGNIRSKDRIVNCGYNKKRLHKGKILKPYLNKTGYYYIDFNIGGIRKKYTIHRLVALAFLDDYEINKEVNHKDCDKTNNYYNNLEWVTRSENTQHAYDNNLIDTSNRGGYRINK